MLLKYQPIAIRRHNLFLHKRGMELHLEACVYYKDWPLWVYHWQKAPHGKNSCKTTPSFQQIHTTHATNGWSHQILVIEIYSPNDIYSLVCLSDSSKTWQWGLVSARASWLPQRDMMLSFKILNWFFKSVYKRGGQFLRKSNPALVLFAS